jgi:hypothetical protein
MAPLLHNQTRRASWVVGTEQLHSNTSHYRERISTLLLITFRYTITIRVIDLEQQVEALRLKDDETFLYLATKQTNSARSWDKGGYLPCPEVPIIHFIALSTLSLPLAVVANHCSARKKLSLMCRPQPTLSSGGRRVLVYRMTGCGRYRWPNSQRCSPGTQKDYGEYIFSKSSFSRLNQGRTEGLPSQTTCLHRVQDTCSRR